MDSASIKPVQEHDEMALPTPLRKLNLNKMRVAPGTLARIATILEEDGAILVANAYIDPNGAGNGALELGKAFQQCLDFWQHVRNRITQAMGKDWVSEREHLSSRDLFDQFVEDICTKAIDKTLLAVAPEGDRPA